MTLDDRVRTSRASPRRFRALADEVDILSMAIANVAAERADVALAAVALEKARSLRAHLDERRIRELRRVEQRFHDLDRVGEADLPHAATVVEVSV